MSRQRVKFVSSDPTLYGPAEEAILDGRSALAVAFTAYLAACASQPGVLLSPLSVLLRGFGAGRAFDGRSRQPGAGARRPRGFRPGDAIPEVARVAIPFSLPALFVAWTYDEDQSRAPVLRGAVERATRAGAGARASVLAKAQASGGAAFRGGELERELVRVAGPASGGLVTAEDFALTPEIDHPAVGDGTLRIPWDAPGSDGGEHHAIVAIDRRGMAVVLCYQVATTGVPLFDGELVCPPLAVPVLRGVMRVAPATALPQSSGARVDLDGARVLSAGCEPLGLRASAPADP